MIKKIENSTSLLLIRLLMIKNSFLSFNLKSLPKIIFFTIVSLSFILFDYLFFRKVIIYIFNLEEGIGNILLTEL
ncbi:MAG: hypothetical protein D6734_05915, partial [Candidatus Schekmanbacteria bacterium]